MAIQFTDDVIQNVFGHEAAEDEDINRLKQYYFKSKIYEKVVVNLPLRILVGHKGIGKSALFKIAIQEQRESDCLPLLIRPDDIAGLGAHTGDFLNTIREWKRGLQEIIAKKTLEMVGVNKPDNMPEILAKTGKVISFLKETLAPLSTTKVDLRPAEAAIFKKFLDHSSITIYVDDLDRGWEGRKENISSISALLNALRDLCNDNPGLRFKLSLRSDVYYLVGTSDESTDKVEGAVVWFYWVNHEILALLVKRIESYFGRKVDEPALLRMRQDQLAKYLNPIMEPVFTGLGKWENAPIYRVLMSLVRKRPRDLVKLCTLAARHAYDSGHSKISTDHWKASFEEYSQGRVQDTINEFRSELPDIERLIINMKPSRKERQTALGYVGSAQEFGRAGD